MAPLTVEALLKDKSQDLQTEILAGHKGLQREIPVFEINRPGLALGGFFEHFRYDRVQVIGRGENAYINHALKNSPEALRNFLKFKIPCIVLTHHLKPRPELLELCDEFEVPLLLTTLETAVLVAELSNYLEQKISPTITLHGVLVDTYGLGVLITGDSGIGKSECALELIKRGHLLVSDDVVRVQHRSGGILIGTPASEVLKHHMEVRGLGIIDVKQLFGVSAVLDFSRVELVVHLELWDQAKEYDRVGLEENSLEVLGVRLPRVIMPVRPGRNLAVLIEVAALYQRLKTRGIHVAQEMEKKLLGAMGEPETPSPARDSNTPRVFKENPGKTPYRRR